MLLLFLLVLLFTIEGICQKTLTKKDIDSLVTNIENIQNPETFSETHELKGWDTSRGNYQDTATYQFTIDSRNKRLLKAIYKQESDNRNIIYYFFTDGLIAAKIVSDSDFPSWSETIHYFGNISKKQKPKLVVRDLGSQTENDVREFLLFEGYSTLKYFNSQKKH